MKPLIILSIIAVLFGAGCTQDTIPIGWANRILTLEQNLGAGYCYGQSCEQKSIDSRLKALESDKPTMVTVQLKTPIIIKGELINNGAWNCRHTNIEDCAKQANEKYPDSVQTTTQIPLQEFVDLLHLYYVPASSTTSNQPAKLVK